MAMGEAGSIAWALMMTVTNPIPSTIPFSEPVVELETEAKCEEIAKAINHKAWVAGMKGQLIAKCHQIEYVDVPEQFWKKQQP